MLSNLLVILAKYLFVGIGRLMIRLTYGKEGWKAAEILKRVSNGLAFFLTIGFFFWVVSVVALVEVIGGESMYGLVFFILWDILFPVIYVLWFIYTRKVTVPAMIKEAKPIFDRIDAAESKLSVDGQLAAQEAAKAGGWTCVCGRFHPMFVSTCVCGVTKVEAKKNAMQIQE